MGYQRRVHGDNIISYKMETDLLAKKQSEKV